MDGSTIKAPDLENMHEEEDNLGSGVAESLNLPKESPWSDADNPIFKTPLFSNNLGNKSSQPWAQHITDSGFNSAELGFCSARSSSLSSSQGSSPDLVKSVRARRVTLGGCHFSPVSRETFSVVRGRKLSFDMVPSLTGFGHDENPREEADSRLEEEGDLNIQNTVNPSSPVAPGLFSYDITPDDKVLARLSPADLESSLQDMSLEESLSSASSASLSFPSSSSSTVTSREHSISPLPVNKMSECIAEDGSEAMFTTARPSSPEDDRITLNVHACGVDSASDVCDPNPSKVLNIDPNSGEKTCDNSCKSDFMSALSLTPSQNEKKSITFTTSIVTPVPLPFISLPFPTTSPPACTSSSTLQPATMTKCSSCETDNFGTSSHSPSHQSIELCQKSPYKRNGSSELDLDLVVSPTKSRRTFPPVVRVSSTRHASRRIIYDEDESSEKTMAAENGSLEMERKSLPNSNCLMHGKVGCLSKSSSTSMSDLESDCAVAPVGTRNLPIGLLEVIQKLSPPEPSRLIGRNMGIAKFDIVSSLSQHFSICLVKIFSFLSGDDLVSVSMVSKTWRSALKSNASCCDRYRDHKRHISTARKQALMHLRHGKENEVDKAVGEEIGTLMTASKGLLSRLQAQAPVKTPQIQPEKAKHSHRCPSLRCDDQLRPCPRCQHPALMQPHQGRAICTDECCGYDFCTQCFEAFHLSRACKPLTRAFSKGDVAGSHRSKKSLKRL